MSMSITKQEQWINTTCPRDCYDGCGIIVHKRNGDIIKANGNRDSKSAHWHSHNLIETLANR
ncbi:MAG TPA: hypothetical protein EYO05_06925 [Gammaproteobacteria bacterium]|nr:hypothetical protein [Gammaproteobacteria bacterium]